jgi:hypothetical protein
MLLRDHDPHAHSRHHVGPEASERVDRVLEADGLDEKDRTHRLHDTAIGEGAGLAAARRREVGDEGDGIRNRHGVARAPREAQRDLVREHSGTELLEGQVDEPSPERPRRGRRIARPSAVRRPISAPMRPIVGSSSSGIGRPRLPWRGRRRAGRAPGAEATPGKRTLATIRERARGRRGDETLSCHGIPTLYEVSGENGFLEDPTRPLKALPRSTSRPGSEPRRRQRAPAHHRRWLRAAARGPARAGRGKRDVSLASAHRLRGEFTDRPEPRASAPRRQSRCTTRTSPASSRRTSSRGLACCFPHRERRSRDRRRAPRSPGSERDRRTPRERPAFRRPRAPRRHRAALGGRPGDRERKTRPSLRTTEIE